MGKTKFEYILEAKYKGRGEVGKLRDDLKKLNKIESIKKLGGDVRTLSVKFAEAEKKLREQAAAMRNADKVTKTMSTSYSASQKAVSRLSSALEKKKQAFRAATESARSYGINTLKLAQEERRLAKASDQTGKVWAARRALGVRSHRDIKAEVFKLERAYRDLARSGKVSSAELLQAKIALKAKTRELTSSTNVWAASLSKAYAGAVALAGVGYGIVKVFKEFSEFETGMAEVNTLLGVSTDRFAAFKKETKGVVGTLPQDSKDLTKALYDIISAGAGLDDANKILEKSAQAATAGLTDTKTAVSIGMGAINAYGLKIEDLGHVYDILFQTVKSGVTTFPELAQSMGEVFPGARKAGVGIDEVGAALASLTKAGINTPKAVTALKGAIRSMAAPAPEAKKRFEELGITWEGLLPTLEAIREKGLSLSQMRMLIPDTEAATGIMSLTQNLDEFKQVLSSMDSAGGSMKRAYGIMADTPEFKIKMMTKSLSNLARGLGELASVIVLPAAKLAGEFADSINSSSKEVKFFYSSLGLLLTGFGLWKLGLGSVITGIVGMGVKLTEAKAVVFAYSAAVSKARAGIALFATAMAENPVTGTALLLAAAAAWILIGKNAVKSAKQHAEAADKFAAGRKEIDKQISSLHKLREVLSTSAPGSDKYMEAERKLAKILPGANIDLDKHGRLIAKVGNAASENSTKLDSYIARLKEESNISLGLEIEQRLLGYQKLGRELDTYKEKLKNLYGYGSQDTTWLQDLRRQGHRLTGAYDDIIQKGEEVRSNFNSQKGAWEDLLKSMKRAGISAEDLGKILNQVHMDSSTKQAIIADFEKISVEIKKVTQAAKTSAAKQARAQKQATEKMKSAYRSYADEVKRLHDKIAGKELSLSQQLREMARSGMSDVGAWKDKKGEATELLRVSKLALSEANRAARAGNKVVARQKFEEAARSAERAKDLYSELNGAVEENGRVVISQYVANKIAMRGVREAGELELAIYRKQTKAIAQVGQELNKASGGQLAAKLPESAEVLEKIKTRANEVYSSVQKIQEIDGVYTNVFDSAEKGATKAADTIKKKTEEIGQKAKLIDGVWTNVYDEADGASAKASTKIEKDTDSIGKAVKQVGDVWTNVYEEAKTASGRAKDKALADISQIKKAAGNIHFGTGGQRAEGRQAGGVIGLKMAYGGAVFLRNMLSGGYFPGFGGGDRRHVIAEDGEVMIRKEAVKLAGLRAALAFNSGRFDIVVRELTSRFDIASAIRRQTGGVINFQPFYPAPPMPLAVGGAVSGGTTGGDTHTYNLTVNFSGDVPLHDRQSKKQMANDLLREIQRMHRSRS